MQQNSAQSYMLTVINTARAAFVHLTPLFDTSAFCSKNANLQVFK